MTRERLGTSRRIDTNGDRFGAKVAVWRKNGDGARPAASPPLLAANLSAAPAATISTIMETAPALLALAPPAALDPAAAAARRYAAAARAPATEAGYRRHMAAFMAWCDAHGVDALPAAPATVALYLADQAGHLRPGTLQVRLAAIAVLHRRAGCALEQRAPVLADVWKGIRRSHGTARRGKQALLVEDLKAIVATLPPTLAGKRDKALIMLGWAAALRRTELVSLTLGALTFTSTGLVLRLARSKTDGEGRGRDIAVPRGRHAATCPVAAVTDWVMAAGLSGGPLLRPVDRFGRVGDGPLCDRTVARVVKAAVTRAGERLGLAPAQIRARAVAVAGHSLRAGFVTAAALAGADEWAIMRQTGHRKRESLYQYVRVAALHAAHPATKLDL